MEGLDLEELALAWAGTSEVVRVSNAYNDLGTNVWLKSQMPWFVHEEQAKD